jgi:hypothetical protein
MEEGTATAADCLGVLDTGNIATVEADDLEFEEAGTDFDSDSDSAYGAE